MAIRKTEDKKIKPFTSINFKILHKLSITGTKEIETLWNKKFVSNKELKKEDFIKALIVKELGEKNFESVLQKIGIKNICSEIMEKIISQINRNIEVENYILEDKKKKNLYKNIQNFIQRKLGEGNLEDEK